jgi:hypothetical protein
MELTCAAVSNSVFVDKNTNEVDLIKFKIAYSEVFEDIFDDERDNVCEVLFQYENELTRAYSQVLVTGDMQAGDVFRTESIDSLMQKTSPFSTLYESIHSILESNWQQEETLSLYPDAIDDLTNLILSKRPQNTSELFGLGVTDNTSANKILNSLGFSRIATAERS